MRYARGRGDNEMTTNDPALQLIAMVVQSGSTQEGVQRRTRSRFPSGLWRLRNRGASVTTFGGRGNRPEPATSWENAAIRQARTCSHKPYPTPRRSPGNAASRASPRRSSRSPPRCGSRTTRLSRGRGRVVSKFWIILPPGLRGRRVRRQFVATVQAHMI